jgi:ubiquinone/menaquinone biosynthesis C-methylase UbiE
LPKYLLQEYHHLPNGNYSKRLTKGYITGFDKLMLGTMTQARQCLAQWLRSCRSVLDVGTAGGRTAAAVLAQGCDDVWGLDPSPYLLQHAARRFPNIRFVQGTAEHTPFVDARFDAVSACFVLHELPPKYVQSAFLEIARILRPDGMLAICEPGAEQLHASIADLWRRHGWRGVYFHLLARSVHEPFIHAWHRLDIHAALQQAGFTVLADEEYFPSRMILARRTAA